MFTKIKKNKLFISIIFLIFIFNSTITAKKVKVGSYPPSFVYFNSVDKKIKLKNYKEYKPVVVSFFATYCQPCKKEIPFLFKQSKKGKSFKLILIAAQKTKESLLKTFLERINVNIPYIYDPFERSSKDFKVKSLPQTIYIGKSGKIVAIETGYSKYKHKKYIEIINSLKNK